MRLIYLELVHSPYTLASKHSLNSFMLYLSQQAEGWAYVFCLVYDYLKKGDRRSIAKCTYTMRALNLTQQKKKIFCHRTVSSSCGVHGLGTRLGLVWLSHQPRASHHQHTDERVWCPSIQLFVAFPRNVKIKTHGYIIKCAKCEARLWQVWGWVISWVSSCHGHGDYGIWTVQDPVHA